MRRCPSSIGSVYNWHQASRSATLLRGHQRISVRQTSRSRANARPLSSTSVIGESYTISTLLPPVELKETKNNTVVTSTGNNITQKEELEAHQIEIPKGPSIAFTRCARFIEQDNFEAMIKMFTTPSGTFLKRHMHTSELIKLAQSLRLFYLNGYIIQLYHIFPTQFTSTPTLLRFALSASLHSNDFALFESLFSIYIQQPNLEPKYFNKALSVFLKTNTEFAKQLLYQMVSAEYPMDDNTIYEFLDIAIRVGTFPTVRFALELIKNNRKVPVSDRAVGLIVVGFLKGASVRDMSYLNEYLKLNDMEQNKEVEWAYFLHDLENCDAAEAWSKASKFEFTSLEMKERCFEMVFRMFGRRMDVEDFVNYLSLLKESGIAETQDVHKRVLESLGRAQLTQGVLHYMKLTKTQKQLPLNKVYFTTLWRSLALSSLDDTDAITARFKHFLMCHRRDIPWCQEALDSLESHSKQMKYQRGLPLAPLFQQRYLKIQKLIKMNDERGLMFLVNEKLRVGIRPPVPMLKLIMKGLISMRSSKDTAIYKLIQDLYTSVPVDVEMCILQKEIDHYKKTHRPREMSSNLVREFVLRHSEKLNTKSYTQLSNIAIGFHDYNLAIEMVARARTSESYKAGSETVELFDSALTAVTRTGVPHMFFSLLKYVVEDKELVLTERFMANLKQHKKLIRSKLSEDEAAIKSFDEEFRRVTILAKKKFYNHRLATKKTTNESIEMLETWLLEEREKNRNKKM